MKESVRILRFALVGTLNALITAVVIWGMMHILSCNYQIANGAGYAASLLNNFFCSKYWVFKSRIKKFRREVPLFFIAFGIAYAAQFFVLLLLVEVLAINTYLSQFLGLFVYGAVNFVMNKKLTFRV